MGNNRVFFPQVALDQWLTEGKVDLSGEELTMLAETRRYRILEAAHVVREVTGEADSHELVGKVKTRAFLEELGAQMLEGSMLLGDNAYDIIPGFLGAPIGSFEEFVAGLEPTNAAPPAADSASEGHGPPSSDEDLLARFLMQDVREP